MRIATRVSAWAGWIPAAVGLAVVGVITAGPAAAQTTPVTSQEPGGAANPPGTTLPQPTPLPTTPPGVPPVPPPPTTPANGEAAAGVPRTGAPGEAMDQHFVAAQKAFASGQFAKAGGQLFEGASILESLGDAVRPPHAEAVATLRVLAYDTASQEVADPTRYDRAFAAAHHVLAEDAYVMARGAWMERRTNTAGRSLESAAYHLDRAITWGGRAPSSEGQAVLRMAAESGANLAANDTFSPVQFSESLDKIGRMLPEVGAKLAEDRGKKDFDERVQEAAEKAVDGIKRGTRKVGEKLRDFGRSLQNIQ